MSRPPRLELLALLDDVRANPRDLTPWLVLCDWLEENGDEADIAHAEYCRLCFDKLGKKTYASDFDKGERRRELFRTWKQTWLGPVLELPFEMKEGLAFIWTWGDLFAGKLPRLLQVVEPWAWVAHLRCGCSEADLAAVAASPGMRALYKVTLSCDRLTLPIARAFVESRCINPNIKLRLDVSTPSSITPEIRKMLTERFPGVLSRR